MENIEICLPVKFISAGQFVAPEKWIHQRRTLDCYTLYLVEKQHFSMLVGEREYDLHPHTVLIIPPGCEHEGKHCGTDLQPVYYWAHFQTSENAAKNDQSIVLAPQSQCGDYNRITVAFRELISESRGAMPRQMACDFQMSLLLIYLSNIYVAPQTQNALMSLRGAYSSKWNYIMCGSLVMVIPAIILFAVGQKYFLNGIVMTGVKG